MELHPMLEQGTMPSTGLYYVLTAVGESPTMRVGHTCSYVPGPDGCNGKVYVVGGANPSGAFSEVFVLDLETFNWDTCEAPGLKPRYEHAAFVPKSFPNKIYIFGGSDPSGNHNDVQVFDTSAQTWSTVAVGGAAPSARTYHTVACVGDRFIVYSGGQSGADPVGDRQVHCFDANSEAWSTLSVRGDSPKPRHGHAVASMGNKLFIHGGMSGTTFYDDLHVLDLQKNSWSSIRKGRVYPPARAAHGAAVVGTDLYVFGGMNRDGALDDTYKFDTTTNKWSKVEHEGPPPACRLDFACCAIRLRITGTRGQSRDGALAVSQQAKDALDQQLRLGSAGSGRSLGSVGSPGSAGSQRSVASLGSGVSLTSTGSKDDTNLDLSPTVTSIPPPTADPPSEEDQACGGTTAPGVASEDSETKVVDMMLVLGGMDTEGELFDDALVLVTHEHDESSGASAGS